MALEIGAALRSAGAWPAPHGHTVPEVPQSECYSLGLCGTWTSALRTRGHACTPVWLGV